MKRRTLSFAIIFLQILIFVAAEGFYSIVAPGTIQPNTDFSVAVALHENPEPAAIDVTLQGPSYNETKTVEVPANEMKVVNFNVPHIKSGSYSLNVKGTKGLVFENSTDLMYKDRAPRIYIQTDKATYKPGDLVQYRIIVLDDDNKPLKEESPLKLSLRDGARNYVKQVNDIKLSKGVYSGEIQLSEQPVLGEWRIEVSLTHHDDEVVTTTKDFEVAKYVLPKYSFEIETAKDITYDDPIKITIRAKYTHGKPVKGKATVKIDSNYGKSMSEKVVDVDGKGHVEFDLVKDLNMEKPEEHLFIYSPPINVFAEMTEELTGNKLNKTANINLHRSRYQIEVPDRVYEYQPNVSFEIKAFVKTIDGSPVQNGKDLAKLTISDLHDRVSMNGQQRQFEFTSELDKNGMAIFKVLLPEAVTYYNVVVAYKDRSQILNALRGIEKKTTNEENKESLKLVKKTENLKPGQEVVVEVQFDKDLSYYDYALVARGKIIKQDHVKLEENAKSSEIKFTPTFTMVPSAYLYVYFVKDGDLKFEEMTLDFPKEFENKIEITGPSETKPGEEVTLEVKTDPDSLVGLLGVDQSVLLLKSGNDLSYNQIMDDLSSYKTTTPYIRGSGKYPGRTSGLVTLTNAHFPYTMRYIMRHRPFEIEDRSLSEEFSYRGLLSISPLDTRRDQIRTRNRYKETSFKSLQPGQYSSSPRNIQPKVRKLFSEVWIFNVANNTDANGIAKFTKNIPDTITSWVVTGFTMNENSGFGMVQNPTNIKVFQPFFASTNLPYSVKRGEVIAIPVILFNYMDKALDAEVTMENTDAEYDFTEVSNEIEELVVEEKQRVKRVTVPSNSGKSVSFMIRPNKVGDITLKIKAITPLAGDAIHKMLKVEPEGVTQYANEAIFVDPSASKAATLKAEIPKEAVLDSEYLEFSAVGDILGPTIKNIDNLVRMPYGCGEQNMVNFVPNILILKYLEATKREMPEVVKKAKNFMEVGYQRELTYKHQNGAYSAFGEKSSEPNSWLTAYVARSFIQAKKYIAIDDKVIDEALNYVLENQLESGQFKQTGRLFHPSHQNDVGFTAFALLALIEDESYLNKYKKQIDKGIAYLEQNIDKESDPYALAIAMLVLTKTKNPSADKLKEKLEKMAHEENGLKWWTADGSSKNSGNNDVEITAYILDAYVHSEPAGKLLPIIKWMIANRNNLGGYDDTQDTVVGLQALARFAEKHITGGEAKMTINFMAKDDEGKETTKGSFSVDKDNSLLVQSHVLPKSSRKIEMEADGKGNSLVYLSYRYNLATKDNKPSFNIKHNIQDDTNSNQLRMTVCADYVPGPDSDIKESNMAIMEIYLPSGFTADKEKLDELRENKQVQRVETKNDDTTIIIYFDYLTAGKEECLDITADKSHAVAKQKPAAIKMYDYYNPDQHATVYYEVKSSLCDICEEGDCGKACEKK